MTHVIDSAKQRIDQVIADYQRGDITLYGLITILNTFKPADIKLYMQLKAEGHVVTGNLPVHY